MVIPPFLVKFLSGKLVIIILIAAIMGMIGYAYYYIDSRARADEIIKADLAKQKQDIINLKNQMQKQEKSNEVTAQALTDLFQATAAMDEAFRKRSKAVTDKVTTINNDPKLTADQKNRATSAVYIDSLTLNFCLIRPHRCVNGVPVPLTAAVPDIDKLPTSMVPSTPLEETKK